MPNLIQIPPPPNQEKKKKKNTVRDKPQCQSVTLSTMGLRQRLAGDGQQTESGDWRGTVSRRRAETGGGRSADGERRLAGDGQQTESGDWRGTVSRQRAETGGGRSADRERRLAGGQEGRKSVASDQQVVEKRVAGGSQDALSTR